MRACTLLTALNAASGSISCKLLPACSTSLQQAPHSFTRAFNYLMIGMGGLSKAGIPSPPLLRTNRSFFAALVKECLLC